MKSDESLHFQRRAEEALDQAQRAIHPAAVRAHYQMAETYVGRMLQSREQARRDEVPGLFDHWNGARHLD